jgi:salicylate hydroxylase
MIKSCIIVGAGIAGATAALALNNAGIKCTIYELRNAPSTIGGAVNLTPNALRLLYSLGVFPQGCPVDSIEIFSIHTGRRLGELPFQKSGGSLRVLREELQRALLGKVKSSGIEVVFGSKFLSAEHDGERVKVMFENGTQVHGDFVIGCDGMHSAVRTLFVDPTRLPIYTGVAVAYSIFSCEGINTHFRSTALNSGRYGSLMTTYVDPNKKFMSAGAVMETPPQEDKEGWRVRGSDQQATMREIERRFGVSKLPCLMEIVGKMEESTFFPVYRLPPGGQWCKGRVILLGDAAHGVNTPISFLGFSHLGNSK